MIRNIFLLLSFCFNIVFALANNYGLYFKGSSVEPGKRTSLSVEDGTYYSMKDGGEIEFDIFLRQEENNFGLLSRFSFKEGDEDLFLDLIKLQDNHLQLVYMDEILTFKINVEQWVKVLFKFSDNGKIICRIDNQSVELRHSMFGENVALSFGKTVPTLDSKAIDQIAGFNLRNLSIVSGRNLIRFWKFEKHNASICYDEIDRAAIVVEHSQWIIDTYINWNKVYENCMKYGGQFAYSHNRDCIYLLDKWGKTDVLDLKTLEVDSFIVDKVPFSNGCSQMIVSDDTNELFLYRSSDFTLSSMSFSSKKWKTSPNIKPGLTMYHTAEYYDSSNGLLYLFGGYANYRYNNILSCINLKTGNVEFVKALSQISPRYHSAMTLVNGKIYIFGGRGSQDGKQLIMPESYNDLYEVDLKSFEVKRCWSLEGKYDFFVSPTMLYEPKDSTFIVFTGNYNGRLLKFGIDNQIVTFLGSPLNIDFNVSYSYFNLYLSEETQQLCLIVEKQNDDNFSDIEIYTLNYPPLEMGSNIQVAVGNDRSKYSYIIIAAVFLVVVFILFRFYRKKLMNGANLDGSEGKIVIDKEALDSTRNTEDEDAKTLKPNSIFLLKEFMIIDKNGNSIAHELSPTLRKMFLILLFESGKSASGVSIKKIDSMLWPGRIESSVNNNRNVYLRKLRLFLTNFSGVNKIDNSNGYLKLQFDNSVWCDYLMVEYYLGKKWANLDELNAKKNIEGLVKLAQTGVLLPAIEEDWLDSYKSNFSSLLIDFLLDILKNPYYKESKIYMQVADALLIQDSLCEEALKVKCLLLIKQGKNGIAQEVYKSYAKHYKVMFGEETKLKFGDW